MKTIRKNVFETNSSSTHSLCVATVGELSIPKNLCISLGEFGWECDTIYSTEEKASYLYTGLVHNEKEDYIELLKQWLDEAKLSYGLETPSDKRYFYIDHSYELNDFLDNIFSDKNLFMNFLFNNKSFIITANDNDELSVDINVDYPHIEYYKGN